MSSMCAVITRRVNNGAYANLSNSWPRPPQALINAPARRRGAPVGDCDEDIADGAVLSDIDQAAQRLAHRHHGWVFQIAQHHVRPCPDGQTANIVPPQRLSSPDGSGVEYITGGKVRD